ncbi:MAG: hypothetical protein PHR43_01380 [Dehalococcoidales bacterium]|nr:hypothetical protein [Dehalococcoidales bacterium]
MVTTHALTTRDELCRFIKQNAETRLKRELLAFLGRHSCTRFAISAICHYLGCHRLDIEEVLTSLISAGLITRDNSSGTIFYSLTTSKEKRRMVIELAALDWEQRQLIARQLNNEK